MRPGSVRIGPRFHASIGPVSNGVPLSITLADSADPVNVSTNFDYTAVVTNADGVTATNVSAVITLDASLTFVSGSGTGWTVNAVGQVVTCTRATLASGTAPTITVTVTAGSSALTASSTASATADNVGAAPQVTQTTRIRATTTLTVTLTDSADPVDAGTTFSYSSVVTNTGSATAENVTAVITLDPSLTFVSASGTGWGSSVVGQVVTLTRATLAVGAAPTITVTVMAGLSALTATSTADADADNTAPATQASQNTSVLNHTVLTVSIDDSADPVNVSTGFSYAVVVTNTEFVNATTVSAVVTLDASLSFVSGSGTGWTVGAVGQVVTCTRASLAPGVGPTITINVTAGASALTASTTADASAANATSATQDTETTRIRATTTLTVAIDDSADPVNVSTGFAYTTTITNTGSATAENVSAVIALDASLAFVSGSGTGWTVTPSGNTITCTRSSLAVGAAPVITINVTAGSSALTASTTADASAANAPAATQDTETTRIRALTTLTIGLTDSADPVNVSTNYNYVATVTNTGTPDAESVSAVVTLDSSLTFVSGSGTGWTVNAVGQVVTCTRATLASGAAPAITITVTAGGSALTATTTGDASAANAPAATQASETTRIRALTTLTVALTDSADPVITAVNFTYSFIVTNTGSVDAETVSAPVGLDSSLTFVSGSGAGWTVTPSGQTITCTRALLSPGAAPTVTITVTSGGSALTASSTGDASAANASAATQASQTTVVKLVTRDATSGVRRPATSTEWTDLLVYCGISSGAPILCWLCQDASGNLADSIGSFTATASGTGRVYQQAVTGHSALGVGNSADNQSGTFLNAAAGIPDVATTSALLLCHQTFDAAPGGTRRTCSVGGSTRAFVAETSTPRTQGGCTGGTAVTGTVSLVDGALHPVVIKVDRTASVNAMYTDKDKLIPTFASGLTGKQAQIVGGGVNAPLMKMTLAALFSGAAAEISEGNLRTLLQVMGGSYWTVTW